VAHKVIDDVNAGQGTIGKLVKDDKLYTETVESMTNLKEILQKINQGNGTVGKLINDQEFYKNAKMTLQKLDKATDGLEDQGPLSVLGIVVSSLL
jgi:phospholipid/cholesterol/gamma-HCH transport system substrate-binding protein